MFEKSEPFFSRKFDCCAAMREKKISQLDVSPRAAQPLTKRERHLGRERDISQFQNEQLQRYEKKTTIS